MYVGSLLFLFSICTCLPYSSRPRTLTNFIDNISGAAWSSSFHCFPFPSYKRKTCLSSSNGFFGNDASWVCNNLSSCCLINWAPSLLRQKVSGNCLELNEAKKKHRSQPCLLQLHQSLGFPQVAFLKIKSTDSEPAFCLIHSWKCWNQRFPAS